MQLDADACYRALETRDARFDGQFFTAVRTTRVFCRPVCPALLPKRENCTFYLSAAAALEAGFRPCLRCRPEIAPLWPGSAHTVSRAMRLIAEGALDESPVEELASRLGIGERQLRRLFQDQLGASPVAVAQARRVLFAKQLMSETSLPFTDIAFASGFSSVRRFNDAVRTAYGKPPREIRRMPGSSPAVTVKLPYQEPYDWEGILAFLAARAIPGIEEVSGDRYSRKVPGGCIRVSKGCGYLLAEIELADVRTLRDATQRVNRLFDVNAQSSVIASQLSAAGLTVPAGIRVPGAWDGFELSVRAILGQQVSVKAARTLAGRLVEQFGGGLFPTPEQVAEAEVEKIGLPSARAAAIRELARACADGRVRFDRFAGTEDALRSLKGIGEWTVQYIAMRALNEPDAFPVGDLALRKAAGAATNAELEKMSQAWRPWRAYAAMALWRRLA